MKKTALLVLSLLGVSAAAIPLSVSAASQDECAIWLCLPGGFPNGCGGAKNAMEKRLRHGKGPLPDFGSCAVEGNTSGGSKMTYSSGSGAWLPKRRVCVKSVSRHGDEYCTQYQTVPAGYVQGAICHRRYDGTTSPAGCRSARYVTVYVDGSPAGETYFY